MITILAEGGTCVLPDADAPRVSAAEAERLTGWTLKPEGMCRGDLCVPLPAGVVHDGQVDLTAFWSRRGAPVVSSDARDAWVLGADADARNAALATGIAPDFTLPDLDGRPHTLSDLPGRTVFLATWASW